MTQQQEMWIRGNMARRQAMAAAVAKMMYSAGGSLGSGSRNAAAENPVADVPAEKNQDTDTVTDTVTDTDTDTNTDTDIPVEPAEENPEAETI